MSAKTLKPQENILWLKGSGYEISISKSAEQTKKELLHSASRITKVKDAESALIAKAQYDDINKMLIEVEKVRKLVKAPVIDKGKEIDQCAANFTQELTEAAVNLKRMIGDFAMKQEAIRREAAERAAAQAAEAARLQREQEEAEARAERLRLGAEQAAAEAESRKERMAAEAAAKQAEAEAVKAMDLSYAAGAAGMQAHQASLVVMDNAKVRGTSVVLDYEIQSLPMLYAAMPHLIEMTPKRRDILAFLNSQKENGLTPALPGLKVTERVSVR